MTEIPKKVVPLPTGNLTAELAQIVNDAQNNNDITVPDIPYEDDTPMATIIPIEYYNHRDVKKALKADKKRAAKLEEYKLVRDCKTDHQRDVFFRMKASEERKQLMTYIFLIAMLWIGGITALTEALKTIMSGGF